MEDLIKKVDELGNHTGNLRMQLGDILMDLEDYQKELLALIKELK